MLRTSKEDEDSAALEEQGREVCNTTGHTERFFGWGYVSQGGGHTNVAAQKKKPQQVTQLTRAFQMLAEWTGLEPATPGVTGRYSNQLNYHSMMASRSLCKRHQTWRPLGDSNPCNHRERVVS